MRYEEILPAPYLRHLVKCFWALSDDAVVGVKAETVLPDGTLEIIFNLADRFQRFHPNGVIENQAPSIVVGQMRKSIQIRPTGRIELFGVRFHPTGAYHFLNMPLSEITDSIVQLDSLIAHFGRDLEEQINEARSTEARVDVFEKSLVRKMRDAGHAERIVGAVRDEIAARSGNCSVYQMSRDFGISQRQLERYFKMMVGVSPKLYCRIVRLQSILNGATSAKEMFEVALSLGYYDQSHFIHEFTQFAGKSPTVFMRDDNRMAEAFLGT